MSKYSYKTPNEETKENDVVQELLDIFELDETEKKIVLKAGHLLKDKIDSHTDEELKEMLSEIFQLVGITLNVDELCEQLGYSEEDEDENGEEN